MIRAISEGDYDHAERFLTPVCIENVYLHWNLKVCRTGTAGLQYWGDFGSSSHLQAVVMRHNSRWMLWHRGAADWDSVAELVLADGQGFFISGPGPVIDPLLGRLSPNRSRADEVMELSALHSLRPAVNSPLKVRRCGTDDLDALEELYGAPGAMSYGHRELLSILSSRRIYAVWEASHIVSAALTLVEGDALAVIGGVYTSPDQRGRGCATACVRELSQVLLAESKIPWLYSNDACALRLYHRLGYETYGTWVWSFFGADESLDAWGD